MRKDMFLLEMVRGNVPKNIPKAQEMTVSKTKRTFLCIVKREQIPNSQFNQSLRFLFLLFIFSLH